jgi:hypothetical protein
MARLTRQQVQQLRGMVRQLRVGSLRMIAASHRPIPEILKSLSELVIRPALTYQAFRPVLASAMKADPSIHTVVEAL